MAALRAALLVGCAAAYESVAVFELAAETNYVFTTAIDVKVSVVGVGLDGLDYFALDEAKTAAAAGVVIVVAPAAYEAQGAAARSWGFDAALVHVETPAAAAVFASSSAK